MSDHEHDKEQHAPVPDVASQQMGDHAVEHAATQPEGTGILQNPIPPEQPVDTIQPQLPPDGLVAAGGPGDTKSSPPQKTTELEEQVEDDELGVFHSFHEHEQNNGDETPLLSDEGKRRRNGSQATPDSPAKSPSDKEEQWR